MGPVVLRSNFSDLYGSAMLPVLEELFQWELAQHPSRREALFQKKSTDQSIWQYTENHDLPLFSEVPEGTDYSFERSKQGYDKTLTPVKFGSGFSISMEAVEDGKFDMIADLTRKLAKSARESQEIQAMSIINNGFSSETTADGVALFSTSHTLPSGGTYRNRLSTDADLSDTSLRQALEDFETQFVGDSGIIYRMMPRVLLVHPSNKRLAKELVGSDQRVNNVASGADNGPTNAMNSLKEEGLIVVSSPHITDSDSWGLLAAPSDTGLRIISRSDIQTIAAGADVGFKNDSMLYKARYREKIGAVHGLGVMFSQGA